MTLCDIFLGLGEARFRELIQWISIGKLKTFQLYERLKLRLRLAKLNNEALRKATPGFWARLGEQDTDFAVDLSQGILISHLDMIQAVLDFLGIPHDQGFFAKDADVASYLKDGWQGRVFAEFQEKFPPAAVLFYVNHLDWEVAKSERVFLPAA